MKLPPLRIGFGNRYLPRSLVAGSAPAVAYGRNCWLREENGNVFAETWNGMGNSVASMNAGLLVPLGGDNLPGGIGAGTVLVWRGDSTWYVGSGDVYRNGADIADASSLLKFLLNAIEYTAGLAQPSAPTLRLTNESNKKPQGTFSIKLTQVRPETGEESNASLVSNKVTATGQRLLVDMTGIATSGDGKRWAIYGTDAGLSQIGDWFYRLEFNSSELSTITDSGGIARANSIAIEYFDFETTAITAPYTFRVPPAGTHLTTLGSVMVMLGTEGPSGGGAGAGISPSLPGRLGFPATFTRFLNPAEPIVRVDGRPGNGWQAVFTKNSVQSILLSGDETGPVFVRSIWSNTGISNESAALMLESEIYAVSGDGYLVRSNGTDSPDTSWANDIRPDVKNIDPTKAVIGYYPKEDSIILMDGDTALAYPYKRDEGHWDTPFELPAVPQTAATVNGKLYVQMGGAVRAFDSGNGSGITGVVRSEWQDMNLSHLRKAVWTWKSLVRGGVTTKLFGARPNQDVAIVLESQTDSGSGDRHLDQVKTNIKKLNSFCFQHELTNGGSRAYETIVQAVIDESQVDA
jgi:hypothetical protein